MTNRPMLGELRIGYSDKKSNSSNSKSFFYVHFIILIVFFTILLSINSTNVSAAPLYNIPQTLIQPDNTEINCFASGDEFFNYCHDADGYLIIKNDETGYYTYAQIIDGDIVASNDVVASSSSEQNNAPRNSRITVSDIPQAYIEEKYVSNGAYDDLPEMNSGEDEQERTQIRSFTPANQFINKTLQNLVKFSDTTVDWPSANDAVSYSDYLLGTNGGPSLQGYINEVSYGKTQINSILGGSTYDAMYKYQDIHPRSYYTADPSNLDKPKAMLRRAFESIATAGSVPSDINLDSNNDTYIDCVTFIVWGYPTDWGTALWPHQSTILSHERINGTRINKYNMQIQRCIANPGYNVFAHEMLHVLGFPDQYRYDGVNQSDPVGEWDMMSLNEGHPCAHSKLKYGGWMNDIAEITTSGRYTINPLTSSTNNSRIIKTPFSSSEYVVVEYRKKEGSYESGIPGTGLLVYKINPSIKGNKDAPADNPKGLQCETFVYRPFNGNTTGDYELAHFSANTGRVYINPINSDPMLEYDYGVKSGIFISNVGVAGDTISFDVRFQLFADSRVEQAVRSAINKPTGELSLSDLEQVTVLSITGNTTDIDLGGVECLDNLEKITFYGDSYVRIKNNDFSYVNGFDYDSLYVVTSGISLNSINVTINKYSSQNVISNTESNSVPLTNGEGTYTSISPDFQLSNSNEYLEMLMHLDSNHDVQISRQIVQPVLFDFCWR